MVLNPIQRSLAQFRRRLLHRRKEFDLIELLAGKSFGKLPSFQVQSLHTSAAALLAQQSRFPGSMKSRLRSERRATSSTSIEPWQPPTEAHRPKREITQGQLPRAGAFDLAHREQEKPEHGLRGFMLR